MVRQLRRALIGGTIAASLALSGGYAITRTDGASTTIQNVAQLKAKPKLAGLKLGKRKMPGGKKTYGVVTLTAAAPMGGMKVKLAAKSATYIKVPKSVKVPAGKKKVRFAIKTAKIPRVGTGVVAAGLNGKILKRRLTLTPVAAPDAPNPYVPTKFTLHFDEFVDSSRADRSLEAHIDILPAAPPGGLTLTVTSNQPGLLTISDGGKVTIPEGQTATPFRIFYKEVQTPTPIQFFTTYNGVTVESIVRNLVPKGAGGT